jgi:cell fate regulator YaaT (PSP1 superfamily)
MIDVVGVRFKKVGKIYYFEPGELQLERGQSVIVETARGVEYGTVEIARRAEPEENIVLPLKQVIRVATEEDMERLARNEEREKE